MTGTGENGGAASGSTSRRAVLRGHRWVGIAVAILAVPLCLCGSALMWGAAFDHVLHPGRYAVSGHRLLVTDAYIRAARAVSQPGDRISALRLADRGGPVVVTMSPAPQAVSEQVAKSSVRVYLDPPTARVLAVAAGESAVLDVIDGSLRIPAWGRAIIGLVGAAVMLSCLTGLWLWLPAPGKVGDVRRRRGLAADLHRVGGVLSAVPLLAVSLTAIWLASSRSSWADDAAGRGARPLASPAQPVTVVTARAIATTSGRVETIVWPTERSPDWTVTIARRGDASADVKVADDTAGALAARAREPCGAARLIRRLHEGSGIGPVWQAIVFSSWLVAAMLAVTGFGMWRRTGRAVET